MLIALRAATERPITGRLFVDEPKTRNDFERTASPGYAKTVEAVVKRWREEEAAVRSRLDAPGVASTAQVIGRSGMEVFEAIFAGSLPQPPIGDTLDFVPIRMAPGEAVFQGHPRRRHYNPLGTVHGGWFATLLDSALGCAIHATLPAGKGFTTLELKVDMVRPLSDRVPLVRAEGHVIHAGRQVATAEGRIVGPDGKLYAHATTTCLIFELTDSNKEADHESANAMRVCARA